MDSNSKHRTFLSIFFFLAGVSFSTWASRIPTIKAAFGFNEAELGTLLFAMPIASLIGLPISGILVSKFDTRVPLTISFLVHAIALTCISFANNTYTLVAAICLFAFSMRILNISVNTQALTLQKRIGRKINGTFHGLWSTGGIVGVGITTLMLALKVSITIHFIIISSLIFIITVTASPYLLKNDKSTSGNKIIVGKPDPYIFYLGVIVFFAAICEGGMFDWSGIYFKEIVHESIFTTGYLTFMAFMAMSRFVSDKIVEQIGMAKTYILSATAIMLGILLAITFPFFWTSLVGFSLVGFGAASIIPITFTLAGMSPKYSSGMAISIVTTYVIAGMLLGPPMIGYLAHGFGLRRAFIAFICVAFMIIPISRLFFSHREKLTNQQKTI